MSLSSIVFSDYLIFVLGCLGFDLGQPHHVFLVALLRRSNMNQLDDEFNDLAEAKNRHTTA